MVTKLPNRQKDHRGGKWLSLTILVGVVLLIAVLVVTDLMNQSSQPSAPVNAPTPRMESVVMQIEPMPPVEPMEAIEPMPLAAPMPEATGDAPNAAKIEAPVAPLSATTLPPQYVEVWARLHSLGASYGVRDKDGIVTDAERLQFIADFLNKLGYKANGIDGLIVSQLNGEVIGPEALLCFINGYIPDKPYIKANCPTY